MAAGQACSCRKHTGRSTCSAALPNCRAALHIGPVHTGVVGTKTPRHRLFGAALVDARQAALAAPLNTLVATEAAARQLEALRVVGELPCLPISGPDGADGSALRLVSDSWVRPGSLAALAVAATPPAAAGRRVAGAPGVEAAGGLAADVPLAQLKQEIQAMRRQVSQLLLQQPGGGGGGSRTGSGSLDPPQAQDKRTGGEAAPAPPPATAGSQGQQGRCSGEGSKRGGLLAAMGGLSLRQRSSKQGSQ